MRQIVYKVERFDGAKSYTQEYAFAHEPDKTILWGLMKIKETIDPTLTFVASCRCAVCGACAVRVNGRAMLACETGLDGILGRFGDTVHIAPLRNYKVIRDLVVDWEPKTRRLAETKPWLLPQTSFSAATGCRQTTEDARKIRMQSDCILCGACASECSKLSADERDFYEPYIYTRAQRFVGDTRDADKKAHLTPVLEQGLWRCFHCQECVTQCPKHVEPAEDIASLRRTSIRMGETGSLGARHALAFQDDLSDAGRLNEVTMAIKTEGLLKSALRFPFALRLMRAGKLNPLHKPAPIEGIRQLRSIIKAAKEAEK